MNILPNIHKCTLLTRPTNATPNTPSPPCLALLNLTMFILLYLTLSILPYFVLLYLALPPSLPLLPLPLPLPPLPFPYHSPRVSTRLRRIASPSQHRASPRPREFLAALLREFTRGSDHHGQVHPLAHQGRWVTISG